MGVPRNVIIEETLDDIAIAELRLLYERLTSLYDGIKIKILALIAGEVAIVPFIFSDGFPDIQSSQEGVLFGIGAVLFAVSFALLLWAISTADWLVPFAVTDSRKVKELYPTPEKLKAFIKEDYEISAEDCLKRIRVRAKIFNITLWLLVIGLIILFVLKYT